MLSYHSPLFGVVYHLYMHSLPFLFHLPKLYFVNVSSTFFPKHSFFFQIYNITSFVTNLFLNCKFIFFLHVKLIFSVYPYSISFYFAFVSISPVVYLSFLSLHILADKDKKLMLNSSLPASFAPIPPFPFSSLPTLPSQVKEIPRHEHSSLTHLPSFQYKHSQPSPIF